MCYLAIGRYHNVHNRYMTTSPPRSAINSRDICLGKHEIPVGGEPLEASAAYALGF